MSSVPTPVEPVIGSNPFAGNSDNHALTYRQISIFSALMRFGNMGLAAEATGSSQPTLSRELARLEHLLGFALFDRVRGRLRPTVRALALLKEVERSFVGLDQIAARARELRLQAGGSLRIACLPALAQALIPRALIQLEHMQPGLSVSVHPLDSPWLEQALSEQRFDLGLSETMLSPVGVETTLLLEANEVAVLPAGHRLARKPELKAEDFAGERFISLALSDPYRHQIDQVFSSQKIERVMLLETASAVAVCACVQRGLGIAIVNPLTAEECKSGQLVIRPLTFSLPFRVSLLCPQVAAQHPHRQTFQTALERAAAELKPSTNMGRL